MPKTRKAKPQAELPEWLTRLQRFSNELIHGAGLKNEKAIAFAQFAKKVAKEYPEISDAIELRGSLILAHILEG